MKFPYATRLQAAQLQWARDMVGEERWAECVADMWERPPTEDEVEAVATNWSKRLRKSRRDFVLTINGAFDATMDQIRTYGEEVIGAGWRDAFSGMGPHTRHRGFVAAMIAGDPAAAWAVYRRTA